MFGKKKKNIREFPSKSDAEVLTKLINDRVEAAVDKLLDKRFLPKEVKIEVFGSTGAPINVCELRYNPVRTQDIVKKGRWYSSIGERQFLGEVTKPENPETAFMSGTTRYEGYATYAAAEKAAQDWVEKQPGVRHR